MQPCAKRTDLFKRTTVFNGFRNGDMLGCARALMAVTGLGQPYAEAQDGAPESGDSNPERFGMSALQYAPQKLICAFERFTLYEGRSIRSMIEYC